MKPLEFYYYNLGEDVEPTARAITSKTFEYLKDNGISNKEIIQLIPSFPAKLALSPSDLPDSLWKDSLLKRNTYYYHSEFHITSPAPYWDCVTNEIISHEFFLEMKINYTLQDLMNYFYRYFPVDKAMIDSKKDKGSLEYLLNKYKKVDFIEPIDFVMYLIDEAVNNGVEYIDIIELQRFEQQTYEYLKHKTLNAMAEKINKIVWR